jgi:cyanate permease
MTTPWLWALAIGLGTPSVVVTLALISLRTRDAEHTAALSSMVRGRDTPQGSM